MGAGSRKLPSPLSRLRLWQCATRQILIATTGIAAVLGLAKWGGWIHSDAVVYVSMAVAATVFSAKARRTLLGACAIVGAFWLAAVLCDLQFGTPKGRFDVDPRAFQVFAALLTFIAMFLRRDTRATRLSLIASLLLAELFVAIVIVYTYGCPTLFEAFRSDHRQNVFKHVQSYFPGIQQIWIVVPWLVGVVLGDILARRKALKAQGPPTPPCGQETDKCETVK